MIKRMVLAALMLTAGAAWAQESRQDVSLSVASVFTPEIHGPGGISLETTTPIAALASYRYLVTPRSGLEANYSFGQYISKYDTPSSNQTSYRIHTRQQEFTVGYVYSRTYRRFNPFGEIGVGTLIFSPLQDYKSTTFDTKRNLRIGGLFGAGVAYELSPSFDLRVEYRGMVVKAPDFDLPGNVLQTNRYELVSIPAVGVAYHF